MPLAPYGSSGGGTIRSANITNSVGATIRAGDSLGRLEPRLSNGDDRASLSAAVAEARVALEAASAEQTRAERLLADRAVPARRVEDAKRAVAIADARLKAAEARLTQREETLRSGGGSAAGNAFALRGPIGGRVAEVLATLGASYDEGAPLFKIVRTDRVELRAQMPAADALGMRPHRVDEISCDGERRVVNHTDRLGDLLQDGVRIDPDGTLGHDARRR